MVNDKLYRDKNSKREFCTEINDILKELFPICRSITGDGVRKSLSILKKISDFEIKEIPSGTKCYDWKIPKEWNIVDAFIEDSLGNKIIDFKNNNLHIVSYSIPIDKIVTYDELVPHLHTLPNMVDAIPYRTTYYNETWGFCLTEKQFRKLDKNEKFHVRIDSSLKDGSLTYGECILSGESKKEFLISTYCCHPSLANDNLSGLVLWIFLLRALKQKKLKYSYRFIAVPETIGAISYLAKNEKEMKKIISGFVLSTVAGEGKFGYKKTFLGNHFLDEIVKEEFSKQKIKFIEYPFDINGSDETHFSSPFFRIPIGTISKDKYYEYEYYHTSKDNLEFVKAEYLKETFEVYMKIIEKIESKDNLEFNINKIEVPDVKDKKETIYRSLNPYCAPMLSKRGIYPTLGGKIKQSADDFSREHKKREYKISNQKFISGETIDAILWIMFYSDGKHSLEKIAEKTGFTLKILEEASKQLTKHKLLEKLN